MVPKPDKSWISGGTQHLKTCSLPARIKHKPADPLDIVRQERDLPCPTPSSILLAQDDSVSNFTELRKSNDKSNCNSVLILHLLALIFHTGVILWEGKGNFKGRKVKTTKMNRTPRSEVSKKS